MKEFLIDVPAQNTGKICGTCRNYQRWECNSKVFAYCGVTPSRRTDNGLLKIKYHKQACTLWRPNDQGSI